MILDSILSLPYTMICLQLAPAILLVVGMMGLLIWNQVAGLQLEPVTRGLILRRSAALIAWVGALVALAYLFAGFRGGFLCYRVDAFVWAVQAALLGMTGMAAWMARRESEEIYGAEFLFLLLVAGMGLTILVAATELVLLLVALETASLASYLLAGWRRGSEESAEAGLRYFVMGAMASACLLYGFSLFYGMAGSTDLAVIREQMLSKPTGLLTLVAWSMVLVGFGFKLAAAPFHAWAPAVYQASPLPLVVIVAGATKLAAAVAFVRLLGAGMLPSGSVGWSPVTDIWVILLQILAMISVLWGNSAALSQKDIRRFLAYSGTAHIGYLFVGASAASMDGTVAALFYAILYGLGTAGLVFLLAAWDDVLLGETTIAAWAGIGRRHPWTGGLMLILVLSAAGLPPAAGFVGKFALFLAAVEPPLSGWALPAVALALIGACLGFFYYLRLLRVIFLDVADAPVPRGTPAKGPLIGASVAAALILLLGIYPAPVLAFLGDWAGVLLGR